MWIAWELAKLLWEQLDDTRRWPKEKRLRAVLRWWSAKASGSPLAWEEHDGTGGDGGPTVRPVYNLMRELRLKHTADIIDYGENVQGEEARAALASYLDAALASDQMPPPPPHLCMAFSTSGVPLAAAIPVAQAVVIPLAAVTSDTQPLTLPASSDHASPDRLGGSACVTPLRTESIESPRSDSSVCSESSRCVSPPEMDFVEGAVPIPLSELMLTLDATDPADTLPALARAIRQHKVGGAQLHAILMESLPHIFGGNVPADQTDVLDALQQIYKDAGKTSFPFGFTPDEMRTGAMDRFSCVPNVQVYQRALLQFSSSNEAHGEAAWAVLLFAAGAIMDEGLVLSLPGLAGNASLLSQISVGTQGGVMLIETPAGVIKGEQDIIAVHQMLKPADNHASANCSSSFTRSNENAWQVNSTKSEPGKKWVTLGQYVIKGADSLRGLVSSTLGVASVLLKAAVSDAAYRAEDAVAADMYGGVQPAAALRGPHCCPAWFKARENKLALDPAKRVAITDACPFSIVDHDWAQLQLFWKSSGFLLPSVKIIGRTTEVLDDKGHATVQMGWSNACRESVVHARSEAAALLLLSAMLLSERGGRRGTAILCDVHLGGQRTRAHILVLNALCGRWIWDSPLSNPGRLEPPCPLDDDAWTVEWPLSSPSCVGNVVVSFAWSTETGNKGAEFHGILCVSFVTVPGHTRPYRQQLVPVLCSYFMRNRPNGQATGNGGRFPMAFTDVDDGSYMNDLIDKAWELFGRGGAYKCPCLSECMREKDIAAIKDGYCKPSGGASSKRPKVLSYASLAHLPWDKIKDWPCLATPLLGSKLNPRPTPLPRACPPNRCDDPNGSTAGALPSPRRSGRLVRTRI